MTTLERGLPLRSAQCRDAEGETTEHCPWRASSRSLDLGRRHLGSGGRASSSVSSSSSASASALGAGVVGTLEHAHADNDGPPTTPPMRRCTPRPARSQRWSRGCSPGQLKAPLSRSVVLPGAGEPVGRPRWIDDGRRLVERHLHPRHLEWVLTPGRRSERSAPRRVGRRHRREGRGLRRRERDRGRDGAGLSGADGVRTRAASPTPTATVVARTAPDAIGCLRRSPSARRAMSWVAMTGPTPTRSCSAPPTDTPSPRWRRFPCPFATRLSPPSAARSTCSAARRSPGPTPANRSTPCR